MSGRNKNKESYLLSSLRITALSLNTIILVDADVKMMKWVSAENFGKSPKLNDLIHQRAQDSQKIKVEERNRHNSCF